MSPVDLERIKKWCVRPDGDVSDMAEYAVETIPALVAGVEALRFDLDVRTKVSDSHLEQAKRLHADLAAARAVLLVLAGRVPGYTYSTSELNLKRDAEAVLSRLGTGEALALIREAADVLEQEGLLKLAARLRAVFGDR